MIKIPSGVEGLDKLLSGGFPKGRGYLIAGEPGTGKTILTLQFLLAGVQQGERVLFVSIDEKPEHIIMDMESLGWNIRPHLESGAFQILDVTSYFGTSAQRPDSNIPNEKVVEDIIGFIKKSGATRIGIDPVSPLVFAERKVPEVTDYIRKLISSLEDLPNCTTLLTSYVPVGSDKVSQHGIEEFAASGIILLRFARVHNKNIRTIWVRKMRGTRIDLSEYSFEILPERGVVLRQPI